MGRDARLVCMESRGCIKKPKAERRGAQGERHYEDMRAYDLHLPHIFLVSKAIYAFE